MVFGEGDALLAQEAHDGVAAERGLSLAVGVRVQPDEGVDADDVALLVDQRAARMLPCETTAECTMLRGEVWRMALTTPSVNTTSGTALKSPLRSRR